MARDVVFEINEVSATEVQDWLEQGEVLLIDVREPREFEAEHIAGAMLLPLSSLDPDFFPVLPGRRVVLHCAIGKRSEAALKMLAIAGHTDIVHMTGGLTAWKDLGHETELPAPEPKAVPQAAIPVHPGRVLAEDYLNAQRKTVTDLARDVNVPVGRIELLIAGKSSVDSDMSLRLAQYFSTDPGFWMHLQVDYDLCRASKALAAVHAGEGLRKTG